MLALRQPPPLPRPADWAESADTAAALKQAGQYALLLATETMAEASGGWRPPTQRQVAAWVCQRAQRIDFATGRSLGAWRVAWHVVRRLPWPGLRCKLR